jgi:D-glycero-alpha-D-manno-heptose-7-phosphate kinase
MIISKTPFRLSLFGGGTDYPSWFNKNESIVIAGGLDYYCYITLRKLHPFFPHKSRAVYADVESVLDNLDFQHPSLKACLKTFNINMGVEIHHDSDLPARTGIGSSSAFTVGLINAIMAFNNKSIDELSLAKKAIEIEQNVLNEPVGVQDQIISAFGGIQKITLGKNGIKNIEKLILDNKYLSYLESNLILGYSGRVRFSSEHSSQIIDKIKKKNIDEQLQQISIICLKALKYFNEQADISDIGNLLNESWELKKEFSGSSIPDDIKEIFEIGLKAGAYGGKLMGAGGSGFFYFLAPSILHEKIKNSLPQIKVWLPVKFSECGSEIIYK